jgi:16S rRNA (cytosine967-C5)-methyltransferase
VHPRSLLDLASALLKSVMAFDAPADAVVEAFFAQHRALGPRERRLLADAAFAALRRLALYDHLSDHFSQQQPNRHRAIAMLAWPGGAAALGDAIDADDRAWLADCAQVSLNDLTSAVRRNLPPWLEAEWLAQLGDGADGIDALVAALDQAAPLDVRVNPMSARRDDVQRALAEAGIDSQPTPYSPWGLRVVGKPSLGRLDDFRRGRIEVQDEGSQLLALLAQPRRGALVVDFCAGAGGKTLALGAAMRNTGRIIALDTSAARLDALKPRLVRSGLANVYPMRIADQNDARLQRFAAKADVVFVDAPCSGVGTLRRHPDLKWRQSPLAIEALGRSQRAILASAAQLVKPGGRLVYATCSLLRAENDGVADWFAGIAVGFEAVDAAALLKRAGVSGAESLAPQGRLRLWPHHHGTDGFFAAAWSKSGSKPPSC